MITLDVWFVKNAEVSTQGTSCLIENLITNAVRLEIQSSAYLDETHSFIEKAKKILSYRYDNIKVKIHEKVIGGGDLSDITSE